MAAAKGRLRPRPQPPAPIRSALTLADLTVTFDHGPHRYTITGRQIAHLLIAAVDQAPSGIFGAAIGQADVWAHRLQGLRYLVFPDAGSSIHEDTARWFVADLLGQAAAEITAESTLSGPDALERFTVAIQPGSGQPRLAPRPAERRGDEGGAV